MPPPENQDRMLLALRYAAGELAEAEAEVFEARLVDDAAARELLGEAVRLSAAVAGVPLPAPRPGALEALRDRLFPTPLRRWLPTKVYRGHPALWAGLGALAASLAVLAIDLTADPPPPFVGRSPTAPAATLSVEAPPAPPIAEPLPSASPVAGMEPVPPMPMTSGDAPPVGANKG